VLPVKQRIGLALRASLFSRPKGLRFHTRKPEQQSGSLSSLEAQILRLHWRRGVDTSPS